MKKTFYIYPLILLWVGTSLLNAEDYWSKYVNEPVMAKISGKGVKIESLQDEMINYSVIGVDGTQSVSINGRSKFEHKNSQEFNLAKKRAQKGEYDSALEVLRPIAYPMVPYMAVPESLTDFQSVVILLVKTLSYAKAYEELEQLILKLDLSHLNKDSLSTVLKVINLLIENGYPEGAKSAFSKISIEANQALIPLMMKLSANLVAEDDSGAFISFYRDVIEFTDDDDLRIEASLMLAYASIGSAEVESLRASLDDAASGLTEDDALYSLYKLIRARSYLLEKNPEQSLLEMSDAFASLDYRTTWAPEFMYCMADSYVRLGNHKAAKSIGRELGFSYPDSKWTKLTSKLKPESARE